MTTRTATSLAADQRALSSALAYLDELKAEREVASDSRTRDLLSELIREQAECVRRLQTWIDGQEVAR